MYQRNPLRHEQETPVGRAAYPTPAGLRIAHISGTSPHHAKILRQGGMGPASGNGSSSNAADSTAAPHNFIESQRIQVGV